MSGSVVFGYGLYWRISVAKILPKMASPGLTFSEHFGEIEDESIVEYYFVFMHILLNETKCSGEMRACLYFSSVQAVSGSVVFGYGLYWRISVAKILPKMASPELTFGEHFGEIEDESIVEYYFVFMHILLNKTKCSGEMRASRSCH